MARRVKGRTHELRVIHGSHHTRGAWYVSRCLQVEVMSQGDTIESSLANLSEALELCFEDEPPPADIQSPITAPVVISRPSRLRRSAFRG